MTKMYPEIDFVQCLGPIVHFPPCASGADSTENFILQVLMGFYALSMFQHLVHMQNFYAILHLEYLNSCMTFIIKALARGRF